MNTPNPNKKHEQTQKEMILEFLLCGCRLTVLDALNKFGCMSLSQRISNFNADGWGVKKDMIVSPKSKKRIAEYYL
jgi:hypothetical protein